jgi:hypothetical protein
MQDYLSILLHRFPTFIYANKTFHKETVFHCRILNNRKLKKGGRCNSVPQASVVGLSVNGTRVAQ